MPSARLVSMIVLAACGSDQPAALRPAPGPKTGAVIGADELERGGRTIVHAPARLEGLATGEVDAAGRPLRVPCATCHALRAPSKLPASTAELDEFHQGLQFRHGALACAACHVAGDQRSLHAADGSLVPMRDAIVLCRQCHGPQARDYDHGAHGGMTGHWDLSAGERVRNHCVDCHDPHTPAFQPTYPVLPPRDRAGGHE